MKVICAGGCGSRVMLGVRVTSLALAFITFVGCELNPERPPGSGAAGKITVTSSPGQPTATQGRLVVATLAKSKVGDSVSVRQLAEDSANTVQLSAQSFFSRFSKVYTLALREDSAITLADAGAKAKITRNTFKTFMTDLAWRLSAQDTVMIYTHSPATRAGLALNNYKDAAGVEQTDVMPWSELGKLILALPAKNVMVFTMSSYSGALRAYLDSTEVLMESYWKDRGTRDRNFLVITSQNETEESKAVQIWEGNKVWLLNGLPYAIYRSFDQADGTLWNNTTGSVQSGAKDGRISFQEFSLYIVDEARKSGLENPQYVWSYKSDQAIPW